MAEAQDVPIIPGWNEVILNVSSPHVLSGTYLGITPFRSRASAAKQSKSTGLGGGEPTVILLEQLYTLTAGIAEADKISTKQSKSTGLGGGEPTVILLEQLYTLTAGIAEADKISTSDFSLFSLKVLVQGLLLASVARWLGLAALDNLT